MLKCKSRQIQKAGDNLNITVNNEQGKRENETFSKIEKTAYSIGLQVAQLLIAETLEKLDLELLASRDASRYRSKGLRKTCIKTICGEVEFKRRVYVDLNNLSAENHCVFLLDEAIGINKEGLVTEELCKHIASTICESTYRATAMQISKLTGLTISAQGVWNIVQKLGESQEKNAERLSELAKENQGKGIIETEILYEENDGIYLHLQGKDRKESGHACEMKAGIAYDGVVWNLNDKGKKRRILDNKVAYAGFMDAKEFRQKKEGIVANRFNVDEIVLRVINGDGAGWVRGKNSEDTISVLDEFHRNKKITECIKDKEHANLIRDELLKGDYDKLLEYLSLCIESTEDENEKEGLRNLYNYYSENKDALSGYYDRGIEIPKTRDPGTIHHARLGSMESNIFTLIGNRMKGRRRNWSKKGANHLALILCAYHTTGFDYLFFNTPEPPIFVEEWVDNGSPLSAAKVKERIGKGYEYPSQMDTTAAPYFLKEMARMKSLGELSFV